MNQQQTPKQDRYIRVPTGLLLCAGLLWLGSLIASAVLISKQEKRLSIQGWDLRQANESNTSAKAEIERLTQAKKDLETEVDSLKTQLSKTISEKSAKANELERIQKLSPVIVEKPLEIDVTRTVLGWSATWKVKLQNRSDSPATITFKYYCANPEGYLAGFVLTLKPVLEAKTIKPLEQTVPISRGECVSGQTMIGVVFFNNADNLSVTPLALTWSAPLASP